MNKKQNEVVQFLLKFKTASEKQLIKLTNCNMQEDVYKRQEVELPKTGM